MEPDQKEFKIAAWAFPLLSWIVAAYFLIGFLKKSGFPPDFAVGTAVFAVPALLFLFLPFFKKIKIGKLLELEMEVAKAKLELSDFKSEVRNTLSVLSTNVNTIGGTSNQVTVNLPGIAELQKAREDVAASIPAEAKQEAQQVEDRIIRQSDEDRTMALARTRIDIERALRELLGKRTTLPPGREDAIKFASVSQLFDMFVSQNSQLQYLRKPFRYVTQICNAAIHAQSVSTEQADEALSLGAEILTAIKAFDRNEPN